MSASIADHIDLPRVFRLENLPLSPTWDQVERLLSSATSDRAVDIRDHAILLLLAIYGLRRGEVAALCLDDIDWQREILHVHQSKQRTSQHFPIDASVGNAILRYITQARPRAASNNVFVTLSAPIRPIQPASVSAIAHTHLAAPGVQLTRMGAHCLRHACARHLLDAGFSLKQIGDQLGHQSASSTMHYAKVDLTGLRQLAQLDMGDLL